MTVDFRKFKFNSRMPMDNVVFTYEDEVVNELPEESGFSITIVHDLGFAPLVFGIFSTNNGESWRDINFFSGQAYGGVVSADSVNIIASVGIQERVSVFKVRIFGFMPSDVSRSVIPPMPLSKFYINTRNKYDALVSAGTFQCANSSSEQLILSHGLGYVPRVMIWGETSGNVVQLYDSNIIDAIDQHDYFYPIITNTDLKIVFDSTFSGAIPPKIHYRIYGRENG